MKSDRYFFAVLASIVLLVSVVSAGIALSAERTEDDFETSILVHDRGVDTEFLLDDPGYRVVEEYDAYLLVETTEDGLEALEERDYIVEELEKRDYVGLLSYSFHTEKGEPEIPEDLEIAGYPHDGRGYYILQFTGPIRGEWKRTLEDEGVALHEFRHRFNFLVEMDLKTRREVEEYDFVEWTGIYHPAYKFDQELLERSGTLPLDVSIFESADPTIVAAEMGRLGADIQYIGEERISLETEAEQIKRLANFHNVKSITEGVEDLSIHNANATWVAQTNEQDNRKVTEEGVTGDGQLITVMDSELYGGNSTNEDHECWEDPEGDPVGDDHRKIQDHYVPADAGGDLNAGIYHGTHVTGSVLGNAQPYGDYNKYDGNAMGARVIFQDVSSDQCGSVEPPSDMYNDGYGRPYNKSARVHTNSWGGGSGYGDSAITSDQFIWDHKDFNILYAMGNDGDGAGTLSAQPEAKNIFSVGAVTNAPDQANVASFSSRGYADDGRIKPTVLHVGEGLTSTAQGYDSYDSMSGTSMATPSLAGQVGQVRHYYEGGWYPDGVPSDSNGFNPSSALVKGSIVNGAVEISGSGAYTNDNRFPNNDQGFGRSKLNRSLYFDGDDRKLIAYDSLNEGVELGTGDSWNMQFEVDDPNQELEVTVVWSDYPGSSGSDETDPAIVNDLDLEVTAPDGTRYVGNAFTGNNPGYSEPDPTSNPWDGGRGNEFDGLNVVEDVLLLPNQNGVETGSYEVVVTGHDVPESTQPFAVVVSGGVVPEESKPAPLAPINPDPANGATGVSTDVEVSAYIEHEAGNATDVTFYNASDDSVIGTETGVANGTRASTTWNGLSYNTTYEWYAVAEDAQGESAQSSTWSFTTMEEPDLIPPSGLRIEKDQTAGDLILKWDDIGVPEYNIYYSEDRYAEFGAWQYLANVTETQYTHGNALGGENYYIVRATDGIEEGENSTMAFCVEKYFGDQRPRHYISIPMGFEDHTGDGELKASDLVMSIEGDLGSNDYISDVVKWDYMNRGYNQRYFYDDVAGEWTEDFVIEGGDGIGLAVQNGFTWHINATDTGHEITYAPERPRHYTSIPY
ncbi:MAG: S8 family serine peptidase, partial [Candidatus Thermoplasmatota archaeon]